ncbi:hypothetical protein HMPREF9956_2413 [Staphylococcus epidermidis 14.1.R1.SE]|nr:hypothetical protein HMPREF9956_2413 [Staphylococcus epidermidis 14.1.R1.SE]
MLVIIHTKYHSKEVANLIPTQTELVIIPDADHCDLYDKKKKSHLIN